MKIILQKFIAQSGFSSRRKAEEIIRDGKVRMNGRMARVGDMADENDKVEINGQKIGLKNEKIYIILNKPVGYVCTTRRFKGERNVFELVSEGFGDLIIVGRLDKDSRGLVFLTNDGDLAYRLTHPKFGHEKKYEVIVRSQKSEVRNILENFNKGIDIGEGDGVVGVKRIRCIESNTKENLNFEIVLTEGKKRQIRRMFRALGIRVTDLARVGFGILELGNLQEGKWRELNEFEIKKLISKK
jgi:pseudouridine synthase